MQGGRRPGPRTELTDPISYQVAQAMLFKHEML